MCKEVASAKKKENEFKTRVQKSDPIYYRNGGKMAIIDKSII